jgi:hypothetical protein
MSVSLQPFVDLGRFFSFLIYTQSIGLLGRRTSPSQGRYLHSEQYKHRINADRHASSGIRNYDPSVRAGEGGSCQCDLLALIMTASKNKQQEKTLAFFINQHLRVILTRIPPSCRLCVGTVEVMLSLDSSAALMRRVNERKIARILSLDIISEGLLSFALRPLYSDFSSH